MNNIPDETSLAIRSDVLKIAGSDIKTILSYSKNLFTDADNLMTITVKYKIDGTDVNNQPKTVQLFAKTVIPKKKVENYLTGIFRREIAIYTDVLPKLEDIRANKKIPKMLNYPIMYKVCNERGKEYILLEDMYVKKFFMTFMQRETDMNHATLILTHLGRLHASSYALRDLDRSAYDKFCKKYQWENFKEMIDAYAECVPLALNAVKLHAPFSEYLTKFEVIAKDYMEILNEYVLDQYATLNHGSTRINNFMFQYSDSDIERKRPNNITFIDFQRTHFGSPAHDLSHFFATNADAKILSAHFDELIDVYLKSFKETYDKFGIDGQVLTKEILDDQMNKYFKRGVILSCTAMWYMLNQNQEKYNSRMFDVVKFAVDRKYI